MLQDLGHGSQNEAGRKTYPVRIPVLCMSAVTAASAGQGEKFSDSTPFLVRGIFGFFLDFFFLLLFCARLVSLVHFASLQALQKPPQHLTRETNTF